MSAHLPFAGGAPFSLSILRTVSRKLRSSSAFAPTTLRAMIEEEAWPSAQAFTSWAKSVTVSPSILRSTVTVEPHSLEWAVALASGVVQAGRAGECRRPARESGGCKRRSAWVSAEFRAVGRSDIVWRREPRRLYMADQLPRKAISAVWSVAPG